MLAFNGIGSRDATTDVLQRGEVSGGTGMARVFDNASLRGGNDLEAVRGKEEGRRGRQFRFNVGRRMIVKEKDGRRGKAGDSDRDHTL